MPYDEIKKVPARAHNVSMEGRAKLSVSGVEDVSGFDENLIVLSTALGDLNIRGRELHIEKIDLEQGQLEVRGSIQELSYEETVKAGSIWTRLFG